LQKKYRHIIQVFEHQVLRIGDEWNGAVFTEFHFNALARFSERYKSKYYTLIHRGVKFSHYVGAIQLGKLTIEILPKADKRFDADKNKWHGVLLDVLMSCRLLKIESLSTAKLKLRTNSILELYFELFLEEIELLLRKGLLKFYCEKEGNTNALKGQLKFSKQFQMNSAHKERFYTKHVEYNYDNVVNQILKKGLNVLEKILIEPRLQDKLRKLQLYFPKVSNIEINEKHFQNIPKNRKTKSYENALEIAQLIILNYSPDIRGGSYDLLAILFDMNLLFEEYVYQQLRRQQSRDFIVRRQQQKSFWKRKQIRPDIVIHYKQQNYIIDTKWKVLKEANPSVEDLRQLFVYNHYFDAKHSILMYPNVYDVEDMPPTPYHPTANSELQYYCQLCFVDILKDGKLNRSIGKNILSIIQKDKVLAQ